MSDADRITLTDEQFKDYENQRQKDIDLLAKYADAHKGDLSKSRSATPAGELGATIRQLKDEVARFGPPEVLPLADAALAALGRQADATLQARLAQNDYYAVTIPVTLLPKVDWEFERLECQIELNPGAGDGRTAVAYDIYPADDWDTIARIGMEVDVGVDETFQFHAKLPEGAPELSGEAAARAKAGLTFVVPPRSYSLGRATALSRGRRTPEVFWRLLGAKYFRREEPRFGIVLQVPKGVPKVTATGTLAASRSPKLLTAAIGSLFNDLPDRLKAWLGRGTPLYDRASWALVPRG